MSPLAFRGKSGALSIVVLMATTSGVITGCEKAPTPAATQAPPTTPVSESSQHVTAPTVDEAAQDATAAVDVINDYYAAINERDYRRAFEHWGQDGVASGKSFEEFVAGFRDTKHVEVVPGTAGRIDPAAGSRYVTIPVAVTAVTVDDQEQRYEGTYDLRQTVVDGATDAQRRWHFFSAALTQTK
ncbi:MAG TPA: hypothetical protein VGN07_03105 [Steroidobacteraceae bacterium]